MMSCVVLTGCADIHVSEGQFFRPDKPGAAPETRFARKAATDLSIARPGGAVLNGILVEQANAHSTVLYFGGNMFHLDQQLDALLPVLAACGTHVAVFDYRGYGRSTGQPTVENMQADALAIFDELNRRYPGRVIVHGQSLGSFMAAYVAQARPVLATVLETTATSAGELVESNVPWYAKPFIRIDVDAGLRQVDNRVAATRLQSPTLVVAAGKDDMTPVSLGKKVFDAIPRRDKQWLLIENAGHNDALRSKEAGAAYCSFVRSL
jgi:pimeloyl-ACP methyl ester carboxylesterase